MPMFERESAEARAKRKADRERMYREENERFRAGREQEEIAKRRAALVRTGYGMNAGRVNGHGGYGVTIHDDGTVDIGTAEIGDHLQTTLPGLHADLETLESAKSRVTATRLLALGLLAFAVPKRDRRRVLVLTGPDGFEAAIVVDASDELHLRQWVAWLNRQGAQAGAPEQS